MKLQQKNEILWDNAKGEFYYTADETRTGDIWMVTDDAAKVNGDYSFYYVGTADINSATVENLIVYTNDLALVLNITAEKAHVVHEGPAGTVNVLKVGPNSYVENGTVNELNIATTGKVTISGQVASLTVTAGATITLEAGSETAKVIVNNADVTVDVKADAEVGNIASEDEAVAKKLATEIVSGTVANDVIITEKVDAEEVGAFAGGFGTEAAPYLIATSEQFANIANVTLAKAYYKLTADVNAGEVMDVATQYVVLDLNGHTINATGRVFGTAQKIEVSNGTVNLNGNSALVGTLGKTAEVYAKFNDLILTGAVETTSTHYGPVVSYAFGLTAHPATIILDNVISNLEINNTGTDNYTGGLLGYAGGANLNLTITNCKFGGRMIAVRASGLVGDCTAPGTLTANNNEMNGILIGSTSAKAFGGNANTNTIGSQTTKVPQTAMMAVAQADASLLTGAKDLAANGEFVITHSNDDVEYYTVSFMFWVVSNFDIENGFNSGYPRTFQFNIEVTDATEYNTGIYKSKVVQADADNSTDANRIAVQNGVTIWYADNTYYVYSTEYTLSENMNNNILVYGYDEDDAPVVYTSYSFANK